MSAFRWIIVLLYIAHVSSTNLLISLVDTRVHKHDVEGIFKAGFNNELLETPKPLNSTLYIIDDLNIALSERYPKLKVKLSWSVQSDNSAPSNFKRFHYQCSTKEKDLLNVSYYKPTNITKLRLKHEESYEVYLDGGYMMVYYCAILTESSNGQVGRSNVHHIFIYSYDTGLAIATSTEKVSGSKQLATRQYKTKDLSRFHQVFQDYIKGSNKQNKKNNEWQIPAYGKFLSRGKQRDANATSTEKDSGAEQRATRQYKAKDLSRYRQVFKDYISRSNKQDRKTNEWQIYIYEKYLSRKKQRDENEKNSTRLQQAYERFLRKAKQLQTKNITTRHLQAYEKMESDCGTKHIVDLRATVPNPENLTVQLTWTLYFFASSYPIFEKFSFQCNTSEASLDNSLWYNSIDMKNIKGMREETLQIELKDRDTYYCAILMHYKSGKLCQSNIVTIDTFAESKFSHTDMVGLLMVCALGVFLVSFIVIMCWLSICGKYEPDCNEIPLNETKAWPQVLLESGTYKTVMQPLTNYKPYRRVQPDPEPMNV